MKKSIKYIICILVIVVNILITDLFVPKSFFGYYRDIETAREWQPEFYENSNVIHTGRYNDYYTIDFVINDDIMYTLSYYNKSTIVGEKYQLKHYGTTPSFVSLVGSFVDDYNANGEVYFTTVPWSSLFLISSKKVPSEKVLYSILPADIEIDIPKVSEFPFSHNGKDYILYIKIEYTE